MGSPDPVTADTAAPDPVQAIAASLADPAQWVPADTPGITVTDRLIAAAIHCLSAAMASKLGQDPAEPDVALAKRAAMIVNAACHRSGNRFVVLLDGSQADAEALARAVLTVQGAPAEPTLHQLLQAGQAISHLCAVERV